MKIFKLLFWILIPAVLVFGIISFQGCDDSVSPDEIQAIVDDLFPLDSGKVIIYGEGSLLFNDTQNPVQGSDVGFNSKWFVLGNISYPLPPNTNPTHILDSTYVPAFGVASRRDFLIQKDAATGNFDFLTNLGFLFRSQKIYTIPGDSTSGIRADSIQWIGLSKSSEGVGREWVAFTANYNSAVLGDIRFEIVGKFEAKETLNIGGTDYEAYRLVATRRIYLGTSNTAVSVGPTAILWLSPNVGPIKIILIGDAESHGKSQTMTAKNF